MRDHTYDADENGRRELRRRGRTVLNVDDLVRGPQYQQDGEIIENIGNSKLDEDERV